MEEGRGRASAGTSACVISLSPDHHCRPCFAREETVSEKVRNVVCSDCQQEHRFQTLCRLQSHAPATPPADLSPRPGMAAGFSLNQLLLPERVWHKELDPGLALVALFLGLIGG